MGKNDSVRNDELLYRSVRSESEVEEYFFDRGKLIIRPAAFNDKGKKPSVDRAELREFDPSLSKLNETDGIVSLIAGDIRGIKEVKTKAEDKNVVHAVDVIYDPTPENSAHSQIIVAPEFFGTGSKQKRTFKKLRIALATLATENGWTLEPPKVN
ncbi:MAG: hypothetical protein OXI94_14920, partial [Gemmatimonadota bacterium]|nr:hypothetical protein [Candidatus Poribacteria bacterium]MDE2799951.1 hypothetical protein [Gemmatimonadota bacterium]